jgi:DNA-directed RNA polymerase specialized sigma24 family protein
MSPKAMSPRNVRGYVLRQSPSLQTREADASMEQPGVFQRTLLRALGLPRTYREVLLLKEIKGCTVEEIAGILGISIDTAQVRLNRARYEIGQIGN